MSGIFQIINVLMKDRSYMRVPMAPWRPCGGTVASLWRRRESAATEPSEFVCMTLSAGKKLGFFSSIVLRVPRINEIISLTI